MKGIKKIPSIICSCTKEEYNNIARIERTRGRAQFKVPEFTKVLGYTPNNEGNYDWWVEKECRECGEISIAKHRAIHNKCRSCANAERNRKWVIKYKSIYLRWKKMNGRCYSKTNIKYNRYGARGITVCEAWRTDFHSFQKWCLSSVENYPEDGRGEYLEIHRIDNDGNYEPANCVLLSTSEHSKLTQEQRRKNV